MKRPAFLITLLFLLPFSGQSQSVNSVGIRLGFTGHSYNINEQGSIPLPFNNAEELSYSISVFTKNSLSESDRLFIGYGVGYRSELMILRPLTSFGAIRALRDLNADSLIIGSVESRNTLITVPLEFQVKLWEPIGGYWLGSISGARIVGGIEGTFILRRDWMENAVLLEYDEITQQGTEVFDERINFRVNQYYTSRMRQARMLANLGIEFFQNYGPIDVHSGLRFNKYIISPLRFHTNNEYSMTIYLGVEYVFN